MFLAFDLLQRPFESYNLILQFLNMFVKGRITVHQVVPGAIQKGFWAEAARIATLLDLITVKPGETKCPHELFFDEVLKGARYLCTLGKVGVVKSAASI